MYSYFTWSDRSLKSAVKDSFFANQPMRNKKDDDIKCTENLLASSTVHKSCINEIGGRNIVYITSIKFRDTGSGNAGAEITEQIAYRDKHPYALSEHKLIYLHIHGGLEGRQAVDVFENGKMIILWKSIWKIAKSSRITSPIFLPPTMVQNLIS